MEERFHFVMQQWAFLLLATEIREGPRVGKTLRGLSWPLWRGGKTQRGSREHQGLTLRIDRYRQQEGSSG